MKKINEKDIALVSVVIPCRNEKRYIGECLDSICAQSYPQDKIDVLVIDGVSEDGTREVVAGYVRQYPSIRLLENCRRITPVAINIGIEQARGEYVLLLGSHSKLQANFIENVVNSFHQHEADCVGGIIETLPSEDSLIASSIAIGLSHPFGVGNSHFRIGSKKIRYVDTVPFGCYRKEIFKDIGMFDEDLVRNQDDELNMRLLKNKGKILLVPSIVSRYYARDSLSKLWRMYFQYGYFKPLVCSKVGGVLTWRQLMPSIFVTGVVLSLLYLVAVPSQWFFAIPIAVLYVLLSVIFSFPVARKKGFKYMLSLPLVFLTLHFSYGTGYLKGAWDFLVRKKHRRGKIVDVLTTR